MSDPLIPDAGQPISVDLDGDQVPDLVVADTNADGQADWLAQTDPTGGITVAADTDDRPGFDTIVQDADGDDRVEQVSRDLDGDGSADLIQTDTNADGFLDQTVYPDGTTTTVDPVSGVIIDVRPGEQADETPGDTAQVPWPEQGGTPQPADPAEAPDDPAQVPWPEQGAEPADPAQVPADDPLVHGDADVEVQYAQIQTESGFCAPVSVGMVLTEFFGRTFGENEMVQTAIDLEFLTRGSAGWSGLTVMETEQLLEHYGIPAHIEPPIDEAGNFVGEPPSREEAFDNLIGHLDQNHSVIVAVDSDETWSSDEDDGTFGDVVDHAVVVTEIDERDVTVTINDPGNPDDGKAYVMATEDFLEAWDDASFAMVVTDAAPGEVALEVAAGGSDPWATAGSSKYAGFVILPVVIAAGLLRRKSRI